MVDLDLEKFFDRVNHDKLMAQIAKRVEDKRLLKLIRAFLNAGVMENGLLSPSVEGTPQGVLFRPCSAISCLMHSIASWSFADIVMFATQMTAISTCVVSVRVNE